ncbi:uncharacterized protein MELLADRAFT_85585 [Melampsora larici-populina 98AG31]|uniref:Uncharacterized protein n=1 Tax=Melampsora larici-populina (strain 98AG31 / pathotype 3-4-7) TaxID=747676 RepID=F4SD70_MELLP|nr:uncharacterized protein MELLADRAFT_85585 [Melampsora larici-populina 98AG31]EGF97403.1 hypothetical protein MELLADRAFT_85585 [Melampsora larici-populina 98AG31]
MGNYGPHLASRPHLDAVARYEARQAAEQQMIGLDEVPDEPLVITTPTPQEDIFDNNGRSSDPPDERPPSPLSYLRLLEVAEANLPSDSETSDLEIDVQKLLEAVKAMDDDDWGPANDEMDDALLEEDLRGVKQQEVAEWYPFKKKEHPAD